MGEVTRYRILRNVAGGWNRVTRVNGRITDIVPYATWAEAMGLDTAPVAEPCS